MQCLIERWWDTTQTFHIAEREMTVTAYNFYHMIGLSIEGAIINFDGVLGIQLGLDMLGRKYSIESIYYFDLVSDYMLLPQRTVDKRIHMARENGGILPQRITCFCTCWELTFSPMVGKWCP